ncbi:conserved hypothetical protein [Frankia canadensis]|uniref:Uncharacterized protein n=1 Tax=Frankia canadensis TaxID=1836972 RepID=A0A2I2KPI0_9ACTN|nr:hypothetical protein [Frankia canadensis]SNQ47566.1 conserved hypothetical protein [Frankia canadensis]SOU54856.1 conserved hypothetical protein [Frankia canadensis]
MTESVVADEPLPSPHDATPPVGARSVVDVAVPSAPAPSADSLTLAVASGTEGSGTGAVPATDVPTTTDRPASEAVSVLVDIVQAAVDQKDGDSGGEVARGAVDDGVDAVVDRLDAAALPVLYRATHAARTQLVGTTDREVARARRLAARWRPARASGAESAEAGAASGPPALLEAVGVGRGGVVDRGARALVLGLVALIVVSATAAMLQSVDHDRTPGTPAPSDAASRTSPSAPAAAAPVTPTVTIGPGARDAVGEYVGASRQNLAALTAAAPGADLYAVASLTEAVTPGGLLAVFGGYRIVEVFFSAGVLGEVEAATVRDPVGDVQAAFASAAAQAQARAAADERAGDANADERDRRAAAELRAGCACLFAAVVRAPAGRLTQLAADPRTRVVDPAPPGIAPPSVTFLPLSPDRR